MDKKRIIIAIIFTLVVVVVGYLLYVVFFKETATAPKFIPPDTPLTSTSSFPSSGIGTGTTPVVTGPGGLPPSGTVAPTLAPARQPGQPEIRQIIEDDIVSPKVTGNGIKFYNKLDGHFYTRLADGRIQELSDEVFFNVDAVTWSPKNEEAILEYPDGSNIYYNFDTQKQVTLPKHWEEFSFANEGDKIAAKSLGLSPENRWIVSTNPDGTNVKLVEPMGNNADKVILDWSPNRQIVGMSRTGQSLGLDREEILFVGLNGENYKSMIVEGRGLQTNWSTEGKQLLYSVHNGRNDFKPELWIVNAEPNTIGGGRRVLNLNTWADKCAFADERYVYCGVPESLPNGAGFAPGLADAIPDRLVKVDTHTGAQTEIQLEEDFHVIDSIQVSEDGTSIFFSDKHQQGLFEVAL
ncbi:MAG: hypothetical protein COU33_00940 [Candidatus Magasanikbacteria bacterium CG10_big_fil_rev_8_21_14_0_10_43_6]|uniref:Dipeptidylpeptidase IV N-terminal domain-containing protein n=1 Tax=Candidatus Magasanikbacteria bacterium CG10_big_fil_rev_8_21_14_0_10_43_6 TaxID=1974650 RepID=A0A2M6W211_9BACT|nr:MAG: hypothetical protein COU33_00940 [Candidatus Magasanikbacteria bacterium CG10_big_fil_rev_8_21_14_0_10_43_6]